MFDFRKNTPKHEVGIINGEPVEIVDTIFDSNLKFGNNAETIATKSQKCVYLLRKLTSFNVSKSILCLLSLLY